MSETALYDASPWYELLHAPDTLFEAEVLLKLAEAHGNGGDRWLEPACGGGRLLAALSAHGRRLTGYDSNARMLRYARRRLGRRAEIVAGRMESFERPGAFDCAYSLHGTFRHLLSDRAALAHLRRTARSLRPGGLYILGLDLCAYGTDCEDDEELWEAVEGRRRAALVVTTIPPRPRARRERVMNFLWTQDGRRGRTIQSDYDLRSYDLRQWRDLLRRSPFRLAGTYTVEGRPAALGPGTRHALFALSISAKSPSGG